MELSARFGVSRPTVREALKRLAAQKLIRTQRGPTGGNFVSMPSVENAKDDLASLTAMLLSMGEVPVMDLFEAREQLETFCVRLAAERRTSDHIEALSREIQEQRRPELTDVEFCASDVSFHRILSQAAGNKMLEFLMTAIVEAVQPVSNLIVFRFRERETIVRLHSAILARIKDRDADGAAAALIDQIAHLREYYSQAAKAHANKELKKSA